MQVQTARQSSKFAIPFVVESDNVPAVNDKPVDSLETLGTVLTIRPGAEIYGEGDAACAWYRVQTGVLRTCKLLPDGRRQIDDFLFPGDFFGLEARDEHGYAAEAITAVTVIRYSRPRLVSMAATDSGLGARLLGLTLKQLDKAQGHLLLLGRKTAEEKVATFLLSMLDRSLSRDCIDLSMSRTDIADYLGLTIETVSRTFSGLKQDGVIALPSAHRVTVLDHDALEALTGDE